MSTGCHVALGTVLIQGADGLWVEAFPLYGSVKFPWLQHREEAIVGMTGVSDDFGSGLTSPGVNVLNMGSVLRVVHDHTTFFCRDAYFTLTKGSTQSQNHYPEQDKQHWMSKKMAP